MPSGPDRWPFGTDRGPASSRDRGCHQATLCRVPYREVGPVPSECHLSEGRRQSSNWPKFGWPAAWLPRSLHRRPHNPERRPRYPKLVPKPYPEAIFGSTFASLTSHQFAGKHKSLLSPPLISPIAAPSEEQEEHEDNKNEIHIFLQNNLAGIFPPAHVDAEFYAPASDST